MHGADGDMLEHGAGAAKRQKVEANGGGGLAARMGREMERSLREFVRLRTVSRDPAHREDCFRGAKFLGTLLESLGAPPCRLAGNGAAPLATVTVQYKMNWASGRGAKSLRHPLLVPRHGRPALHCNVGGAGTAVQSVHILSVCCSQTSYGHNRVYQCELCLEHNAGAEIKMAHGQEDRNPVVLGRIGRDPAKPTVCFYGVFSCRQRICCPSLSCHVMDRHVTWRVRVSTQHGCHTTSLGSQPQQIAYILSQLTCPSTGLALLLAA